jgi:ribosomal-protein-alanine N-acetyltransferase
MQFSCQAEKSIFKMNQESKIFPILTTERLTLRQLSENDSIEILQLRSKLEINKFLDRKPSKTLEDALSFIKSIIENENDKLFIGQLQIMVKKN